MSTADWSGWTCPHGMTTVQLKAANGCPGCISEMECAPDPATMTGEERAAELQRYKGPICVPFRLLRRRIAALVGRPVWTHEMALWDQLVEEARTWQHATDEQVMAKAELLMPNKPGFVLDVSAAEEETP